MLLDTARDCIDRLKKAQANRAGIHEAQALAKLQQEIASEVVRIHELCEEVSLLRSEGVAVRNVAQLAQAITALSNASSRFKEKAAATTLRQGKRWTGLMDALENLSRALQVSVEEDWKAYVGSALFGGAPPEQLQGTLARTPANDRALQTYTQHFKAFASLRSRAPANKAEFKTLRDLSRALVSIKFQTNVPPDVQKFLEATKTEQGAGISLLTDGVRDWLRDNDLLGTYVIRSKLV
jgi:hypothetical protein